MERNQNLYDAQPPQSVHELLRIPGQAFIRTCFRTILGREADTGGFQYYWDLLQGGEPKESIIAEIAASAEGKHRNPGLDGLQELLKRHRKSFWRGWGQRLGALARSIFRSEDKIDALLLELAKTQAQLAVYIEAQAACKVVPARQVGLELAGLINTLAVLGDEEFVRACYRELLGREADPDGFQHHFQALQSGYPKPQMLFDFATSEEARNRIRDMQAAEAGFHTPAITENDLSPRARQIYADLKAALARRQQEAR